MEWAGWLPSTVVVIYGQSQASKPASRSNPCNTSLLLIAGLRRVSRLRRMATRLLSGWITMELGAHDVGEVVVTPAVVIDGPKHGADHAWVASGLE